MTECHYPYPTPAPQYVTKHHPVTDLRDYFAAHAMSALIRTRYPVSVQERLTKEAYGFADAMLAQREAKPDTYNANAHQACYP
jgi:hypothetical protein